MLPAMDGASLTEDSSPPPGGIANDIENLVFRGGGVKGLAYCGALSVLFDLKKLDTVKRYAGSSAGAITASLLAVGYTPHELEQLFKATDFNVFKDSDGLLNRAEKLYKSFGMYKGKVFYDWLGKLFHQKTGKENITFAEVFEFFQKEVVIVGTCVSHMEVHYFSTHMTPDMFLRDAVRISMSIPLFFEPVALLDHLFVDGGVTENFPLSVFDVDDFDYEKSVRAPVNMKTLGFFLVEDKTRHTTTRKIDGIKDFVGCLLDTVKQRIAALSIKPGDEKRTIFIHTRYISSTQFNISEQEKDLLYHEGQSAARKFCGHKLAESVDNTLQGRLIVKLIEGTNLRDHIMPDDPYCVFTIDNEVRKSSIKYKKLNPVWKEVFVFKITDFDVPLRMQVFDYELLRPPKLLGNQDIPLDNLPEGIPTDMWVNIQNGKVHLEITRSHYC